MARRGYDNSFRSEQAEQTKTRLVDAARDLLAESGQELTMAAVAAKAGVSEPTAYRHFPSREALLNALAEGFARAFGEPQLPASAAELPSHMVGIAEYFGRNAAWMRSSLKNPQTNEVRVIGRKRREASLRKLLAPELEHLELRERDLVMVALLGLIRLDTWNFATEWGGLTDREAGRSMGWVIEAILSALGRDRRAKRTRIEPSQGFAPEVAASAAEPPPSGPQKRSAQIARPERVAKPRPGVKAQRVAKPRRAAKS